MNEDLQQQFVRDMLTESFEGLDSFDQAILQLENGQSSKELLNDIFRVVHTLKGTAGCLGFVTIQDTAHVGENLLDLIRSGKRGLDEGVIAVLFALSDTLRAELQKIEDTGTDGDHPDRDLIARLEKAIDPSSTLAPPVKEQPAAPAPATEEIEGFGLFDDEPVVTAEAAAEPAAKDPDAPNGKDDWGLFEEDTPLAQAAPEPSAQPSPKTEPTQASHLLRAKAKPTPPPQAAQTSSIRVDVDLLDQLMNMVGELVLTRNQLIQKTKQLAERDGSLKQISQRLNLITTDLQEGIMKTRMQAINVVWSKFPRIVRDISQKLGKKVVFETFGADTELDRTILEAIRDPLTHIVRNSLDHGLETPAQRLAVGKPEEGMLLMRAFHEGGQVNIEIVDDGGGVKLDKVKARALERGLISASEASKMNDRELANLVFAPGFSTADTVSDVSGRGVGMDVVRTNIEKIGGSVDLMSDPGKGTTVKIKIPLTLAIIPALVVEASGQRFAIPQVNLLEVVQLDSDLPNQGIEEVYGAPVFRLRNRLLPLVYLRSELGFDQRTEGDGKIVVLRADDQEFGLVVDCISDTEEIVVKPLSRQLKNLPMFAGATIMGDGQVALIMDLIGLAERARVLSAQGQMQAYNRQKAESEAIQFNDEASKLLLFSLPGRPNLGLDLDQATRLENFPRNALERSGHMDAVQYRGGILPIVRMGEIMGGTSWTDASNEEDIPVIVCRLEDRLVGLAVGDIRDVIETKLVLQPGSKTTGTLGSAVVEGKIVDIIDLKQVLSRAFRVSA